MSLFSSIIEQYNSSICDISNSLYLTNGTGKKHENFFIPFNILKGMVFPLYIHEIVTSLLE